jgi:hypothetical protein
MVEIQWWYARGDEQFGPVSAAELRRLASTGALSPGDLVWREGLAEWAPAARLKGLFPETPAAPAPREPAAAPRTGSESDKVTIAAPAVDPRPATITEPRAEVATQETAELSTEPPSDPVFASFTVVEQPPGVPPVEIPPPPPPSISQVETVVAAPMQRPRISHLRLARMLALVQGVLWGTCVLVILFGGLVFTWARLRATSTAEEAASATVFGMFFIGAYVVARAGEKISQLLLAHVERRRG